MIPLYFERPPTFQHIPDLYDLDYVYMIIYKDDGTQERKRVFHSYFYVSMYFELIRTCQYDMEQVEHAWKQWWQNGRLNQLNVDLRRMLTGE
jgi:hypothetical protein